MFSTSEIKKYCPELISIRDSVEQELRQSIPEIDIYMITVNLHTREDRIRFFRLLETEWIKQWKIDDSTLSKYFNKNTGKITILEINSDQDRVTVWGSTSVISEWDY